MADFRKQTDFKHLMNCCAVVLLLFGSVLFLMLKLVLERCIPRSRKSSFRNLSVNLGLKARKKKFHYDPCPLRKTLRIFSLSFALTSNNAHRCLNMIYKEVKRRGEMERYRASQEKKFLWLKIQVPNKEHLFMICFIWSVCCKTKAIKLKNISEHMLYECFMDDDYWWLPLLRAGMPLKMNAKKW